MPQESAWPMPKSQNWVWRRTPPGVTTYSIQINPVNGNAKLNTTDAAGVSRLGLGRATEDGRNGARFIVGGGRRHSMLGFDADVRRASYWPTNTFFVVFVPSPWRSRSRS